MAKCTRCGNDTNLSDDFCDSCILSMIDRLDSHKIVELQELIASTEVKKQQHLAPLIANLDPVLENKLYELQESADTHQSTEQETSVSELHTNAPKNNDNPVISIALYMIACAFIGAFSGFIYGTNWGNLGMYIPIFIGLALGLLFSAVSLAVGYIFQDVFQQIEKCISGQRYGDMRQRSAPIKGFSVRKVIYFDIVILIIIAICAVKFYVIPTALVQKIENRQDEILNEVLEVITVAPAGDYNTVVSGSDDGTIYTILITSDEFSKMSHSSFLDFSIELDSAIDLLEDELDIWITLNFYCRSNEYKVTSTEILKNGNVIYDQALEDFKEMYGDSMPYVGMSEKYIDYTGLGVHDSMKEVTYGISGVYRNYYWGSSPTSGEDFVAVKVTYDKDSSGNLVGTVVNVTYKWNGRTYNSVTGKSW